MYNINFHNTNNQNNSNANISPYNTMQQTKAIIIELYHREIKNLSYYKLLLDLSPNQQDGEIIGSIIHNTINNISALETIYIGITGTPLEKLSMPSIACKHLTYTELLKNTMLSKLDTLDKYDYLYQTIPVQQYKELLFFTIVSQLKDANFCNYLISQDSASMSK